MNKKQYSLCAILGFILSWFGFLMLPLNFASLILSVAGLIISLTRKVHGKGLAIFAIVIDLMGISPAVEVFNGYDHAYTGVVLGLSAVFGALCFLGVMLQRKKRQPKENHQTAQKQDTQKGLPSASANSGAAVPQPVKDPAVIEQNEKEKERLEKEKLQQEKERLLREQRETERLEDLKQKKAELVKQTEEQISRLIPEEDLATQAGQRQLYRYAREILPGTEYLDRQGQPGWYLMYTEIQNAEEMLELLGVLMQELSNAVLQTEETRLKQHWESLEPESLLGGIRAFRFYGDMSIGNEPFLYLCELLESFVYGRGEE